MRLRGFRFLHYLSHPCSGPQSRDDTHTFIHTQSCPTTRTHTHTQLLPTTQAHNMTLHPHKATYNLDPTSLSHSSILPACSLSSVQLTPKCRHTRNLITVSHSGPPSPTLAYVTGLVDFSPSNSLGCFGPRHSHSHSVSPFWLPDTFRSSLPLGICTLPGQSVILSSLLCL